MKHDKVIKKLKGIGFKGPISVELTVNEFGCYYFSDSVFEITDKPVGEGGRDLVRLENPTFKQILKAIKKHTGQDLKPSIEDKLEKLGFSPYSNANYPSKTINGLGCYYFNYKNDIKTFDINSNPVGDGGKLLIKIYNPTFKRIKAAIKKYTNPVKVVEPEEFVFGGYAEVLCSHTPFAKGSKVRTGFIDNDDTVICDDGNSFYWVKKNYLKPL